MRRHGLSEAEVRRLNFYERVYESVQRIPKGRVASYGQIARLIGRDKNSRLVGKVLSMAEYYGRYPCHRVVNRSGTLAPSHVFGGMQRAMLEAEGVPFLADGRVDLAKCLWLGPEA